MLTTKNYKLKKPELTDSPPDITVMNFNWDTIDEKLFAVIQAWENFKANGGEFGGNIVRVNHEKQYDWIFGHSGFTDKSAMISLKDRVTQATMGLNFNLKPGVSSSISPISNGEMDFGLPNYTFKDIYVGSVSKNSNGYNKLTNGMIYQWGQVDVTMSQANNGAITVTFPTAFTTFIRSFGAICSGNSFGWGNSDIIVGNAGCSNNDIRWSCSTRNGSNVNGKAQVTWWALGY